MTFCQLKKVYFFDILLLVIYMKFSEELNRYMKLCECSAKDLARTSSLSESIISRYKTGSRIPNDVNLKKICNALEILSNNKYSSEKIESDFYNCINRVSINFDDVKNNLNTLIETFNINAGELAKFLNFDASYLSKIRKGERIPSNKQDFINTLATFIDKKYNTDDYKEILNELIDEKKKNIALNDIKKWIINNKNIEDNQTSNFLKTLDEFNLDDYIKAIKFDTLKVPNIPFYKGKTKTYYGIEEMKQAELDFFKIAVLSKNKDDIFMYSNMPMEDMAKDIDFGKKWMFGIAMSLKKGLHLNIIHNLDRPFNELMLGLESWIPIYMTGQISPFYFNDIRNDLFQQLNYTCSTAALSGDCIKGYHNKGKYYLTNKPKEIEYFKERSSLLLKKAKSLMDIYKEDNIEKFNKFLIKDKDIQSNRIRTLSSLPLFTIDDKLLLNILERNNISSNDIDLILKYKKEELKNIKYLLKNNLISDTIFIVKKEEFEKDNICLSLENIFYNKKIKYNYEEYLAHLNSTKEFAKNNCNYKLVISNYKTFKNITISIVENNYVIVSKNSNPVIHFIIRHPKLMNAIKNFDPIVKEK